MTQGSPGQRIVGEWEASPCVDDDPELLLTDEQRADLASRIDALVRRERATVAALRAYLDAEYPGWRTDAFDPRDRALLRSDEIALFAAARAAEEADPHDHPPLPEREKRDALVAALRRYGRHETLCSVTGGYDYPCTCGFAAALKVTEPGR